MYTAVSEIYVECKILVFETILYFSCLVESCLLSVLSGDSDRVMRASPDIS